MEIDSDIPHFLASQKQQAPASLQNYYNTFEDLYERKYVRPSYNELSLYTWVKLGKHHQNRDMNAFIELYLLPMTTLSQFPFFTIT